MATSLRWGILLVGTVTTASVIGAGGCSSSKSQDVFCPTCPTGDGSTPGDDSDGSLVINNPDSGIIHLPDGGTVDPSLLTISPTAPTLDVTTGATPPTATFVVSYNGQPAPGSVFSIDRGELGAINATTGVFTPSGTLGGVVTVTGNYLGATVTAKATVHLATVANGDPNAGSTGGAGGYNGVGGDGTGGAVSSTSMTALDGAATADAALAWLYPYDQTVFPRGILPPLLMWNVGTAGDYDSIKIHLSEANYDYVGYFAKPAAATTAGTPFKNHPVLSDAWTALYNSNNGNEAVTVDITLAKGGTAYKLPTRSWTIANGYLQGTVYYQAYNTQLVKNSDFTVNKGGTQVQVGAGTLAIKRGSTSPQLIAGVNGSTQGEGCRVCHVVSGDGSTLFTQKTKWEVNPTDTSAGPNDFPNYWQAEKFNLASSAITESSVGPDTGIFAWGGLTPNASLLFGNSGGGLAGAIDQDGNYDAPTGTNALASKLYNVSTATAVTTTGLPADLQASMPAFSPDGKHVAFDYYAGGGGTGDGRSLGIVDFDGTATFTNLRKAYTPAGTGATNQVVWPSFLPTSDAVVFGIQLAGAFSVTNWNSTYPQTKPLGELWWYDVKSNSAHALTNLNGVGLPDGPNTHTGAQDATLNFEPTVNPVPSGGYAWVVFTSRRIYGNVATLSPWASDPRYDDGVNSVTQPTPKKLWVAAIDLSATGGTDPSHPAFYLPAQELLGGNSRGYWTVDPCAADGTSCETGDQCCGGYCQQNGDGGALTCSSQKPACSQEFDKCTTDSDCCAGAGTCINNRCATPIR